MFSVIRQEKTPLRDQRGGSIFRRSYLCDFSEEIASLPTGDAPGSVCFTADEGKLYVLNHSGVWCACPAGGVPWLI